jgi:hypothetical protein
MSFQADKHTRQTRSGETIESSENMIFPCIYCFRGTFLAARTFVQLRPLRFNACVWRSQRPKPWT